MALVFCKITEALGIPSTLPFFNITGLENVCGVTAFSPNIGNTDCVRVPVLLSVKNISSFAEPSVSKLIKSSIVDSLTSISCNPLGLIRYNGPSPRAIVINTISVEKYHYLK